MLSLQHAPEGNRTPDLQLEKLASLANGDSGSEYGLVQIGFRKFTDERSRIDRNDDS